MSILIALIIFTAIVVIHEYGHFIAARRNGIYVEEFAVGMGPKLFGIRKGETLYSVRLFPIGGFCKMMGEDSESNDSRAFGNKTVLQRIAVVCAGSIMNLCLALVLFTIIVLTAGYAVPIINDTLPDSPARTAGLVEGDRITKLNGASINIYEDLIFALSESKGRPINVTFVRDGQTYEKEVTPYKDANGDYKLGFRPQAKTGVFSEAVDGYGKAPFFGSIANGFFRIIFYIKVTFLGFIRLITMKLSVSEMAGPIGVVSVIDNSYKEAISESIFVTVQTMANIAAILSANLGVINLMPLPALDGGRLAFLLFEGVRRKKINSDREGLVHLIGFVLLMLLAVVIAYNDIRKMM